MTNDTIIYRGRTVISTWPDRLAEAQEMKYHTIAGSRHKRVRYGDEDQDWGDRRGPCPDCAAIMGELHVPGCEIERCPMCGGQVLGCDCVDDKNV